MDHTYRHPRTRHISALIISILVVLLVLVGCGSNPSSSLASRQVLTLPNVGTEEIGVLDPAQGPDANSAVAVNMIYSGLVKVDKNLGVLPDQATWDISSDKKVYTFKLRPDIKFSDGTQVTAQDYVYTWTRALLPEVGSPIATFFESNIVGASDVNNGKTKTLSGVKALDAHTLQVTLTQSTPYFLEDLTTPLFDPLNHSLIDKYGQKNWTQHVMEGAGTGPFSVKTWNHRVSMIFVPNQYYYGPKTKLTEVDMPIVNDPSTAFKAYRAGQYSLIWNILPTDQQAAEGLPGFMRQSLLQTDLLFFDNAKPPFNNVAVRQAFAYAIDRNELVHAVFKDTVQPAPTIIPPGMPGYQPNYPGLPYNRAKAKQLLQSVYPDVTKLPSITFSYPSSQVSSNEVAALQQMWQNALGIQVKVNAIDLTSYNDKTAKHLIQFGFTQWGADFPDPYDWLALNLTTNAGNNNGQWSNATFDHTIAQAETLDGQARLALYNKAEQIAIQDVGWLPIDHQALAAVIPSWVHGVTLNGDGLYFGDWSNVYISQH
ncbi:MAG TPA: peptide ABC transporter substrate-binding protein [Ktedonobacteraceae bacterium]|jgi:ABC-type oligopeptide transport system substrate-binding subunit